MITPEQYDRWHDFALRMARTCFKRKRNPSAAEIEMNVEHFFECLPEEERWLIVDWDDSDPYPEGHRFRLDRYGRVKKPLCVGDLCKEHEDGWNPYYSCDEYGTTADEKHYDQFVSPVVCCIRAGLDMAVSPSAGVAGFTAGDLRRMYPEGVPDWITGGDGHRWAYAWTSPVKMNGTFAEMSDDVSIWL